MSMLTENTPVVTYGPWNEDEYAMFERRCPKCGRLVKADESSGAHESAVGYLANPTEKKEPPPNATCSRCGRVRMAFLGWTGADEEGDADGL